MDETQEKTLTHNGKQYKKVNSQVDGLCDGCCFSTPYDGFGSDCRKPTTKEFTACGLEKIYIEVKS